MKMKYYKNKNELTKKYRYKLIETRTNKFSETVYEPNSIDYKNTTRSEGGKSFHFLPYNYKPYFLFKFWWNLVSWIKRFNIKTIIEKSINHKISKETWIIIRGIIIVIIAMLIWTLFGEEIVNWIKTPTS